MQSRYHKHKMSQKLSKGNEGYILVITVVLLAALLLMTLKFFERTSDSLQMAGYDRGATESLLVAESAMNMLFGLYQHDANLDDDGEQQIPDIQEALDLNNWPLHYMYFASADNEINQAMPSILQKIANGEARNESGSVNSNIVNIASQRLKVENLYAGSAKPIVFEFNAQDQIILSTKSWADIKSTNSKAGVAWLEIVKNDSLQGDYQIYVQAVGRVGNSQSYVQRIIAYVDSRLGSFLPTMGQG